MLQNLLENAWKYTRDKSPAVVEVGITTINGETAYFVKDNGIGFSMDYVDKLFRPFHRLHTQHDYEGTGIGLATVARILNRHGGRIWVDAAVDQGATFFFTVEYRQPMVQAGAGEKIKNSQLD